MHHRCKIIDVVWGKGQPVTWRCGDVANSHMKTKININPWFVYVISLNIYDNYERKYFTVKQKLLCGLYIGRHLIGTIKFNERTLICRIPGSFWATSKIVAYYMKLVPRIVFETNMMISQSVLWLGKSQDGRGTAVRFPILARKGRREIVNEPLIVLNTKC
jgi:hypothetical protein